MSSAGRARRRWPSTAALAEHGDVVGVDLSARQLELARERIPGARFLQADMATVEFAPASFDAVTACAVDHENVAIWCFATHAVGGKHQVAAFSWSTAAGLDAEPARCS